MRSAEVQKENLAAPLAFRWQQMSHQNFVNVVGSDGAIDCRLRPVVRVAKMLKRHLPNLLNYFRHRITNAASEGFNSVIQSLRYAARGFRNFTNYRARILFFCGKLDLKPAPLCH